MVAIRAALLVAGLQLLPQSENVYGCLVYIAHAMLMLWLMMLFARQVNLQREQVLQHESFCMTMITES